MYCEHCGKEIPDDSAFCPECGHAIDRSAAAERDGRPPVPLKDIKHKSKKKSKKWITYLTIFGAIFVASGFLIYRYHSLSGGGDEAEAESTAQKNNITSIMETGEVTAVGGEEMFTQGDAGVTEGGSENDVSQLPTLTSIPSPEPSHRYEAYVEDVSWTEAFERAKEKGGRLARIRNEKEWDKVIAALDRAGNNKVNFYIGAGRDMQNVYHWVDENMQFVNGDLTQDAALSGHWYAGEPSYEDHVTVSGQMVTIEENCLTLLTPSGSTNWYLNDANADILTAYPAAYNFSGKIGYVVEYDA